MIVWPSSAPTWKVTVGVPESSVIPLNFVSEPMRAISWPSEATSFSIEVLSLAESVPFLYWTASSRTRPSMLCTSWSEPSAVCTSEIASCALRWAWPRPPIWARSFSEMASPAASSAARLIRKPEARRSIDFADCAEVFTSCRWALNASTLF